MTIPFKPTSCIPHAVLVSLLVLLCASCRKHKKPERISIDQLKVVIQPELRSNQLEGLKGAVYEHFLDSSIHWQAWDPQVLKRAKDSKRLIFAIIARPQHPDFFEVMRGLEESPQLVEIINSKYVPVIIDADVAREFGMLAFDLSNEIRRPVAFPLFLWMDYNAHTVACTPVMLSMPGGVLQVFDQSHAMIDPMWEEDLEKWMADGSLGYVIENSAHDHLNRKKRTKEHYDGREFSDDTRDGLLVAIRQLQSEYDPYARSFSAPSGMVPFAAIRLLAKAATREGLPEALRKRSGEVVESITRELLASPMIDPLDGGVFGIRSASSWQLPAFSKNGTMQALIAEALLMAHQISGDAALLNTAKGVIHYMEQHHRTADGLFVLGPDTDSDPQKWMWSTDEVSDLIGAEDAAWWETMTGMKSLGNLPMEADPTRKLFRKNALAVVKSVPEMAKELSLGEEEFRKRFEAARNKVLTARTLRLRDLKRNDAPHLESSFRMVSTYVTAWRVTGDEVFRQKALSLLERSQQEFIQDGLILPFGKPCAESFGGARAMHHLVVVDAALDAASMDSDPVAPAWVVPMLEGLAKNYMRDGVLHEDIPGRNLMDVTIENDFMLFGPSTIGMLSQLDAALPSFGLEMPEALRDVARRLPVKALTDPMIYTDILDGCLDRHFPAVAPHANDR